MKKQERKNEKLLVLKTFMPIRVQISVFTRCNWMHHEVGKHMTTNATDNRSKVSGRSLSLKWVTIVLHLWINYVSAILQVIPPPFRTSFRPVTLSNNASSSMVTLGTFSCRKSGRIAHIRRNFTFVLFCNLKHPFATRFENNGTSHTLQDIIKIIMPEGAMHHLKWCQVISQGRRCKQNIDL